jgi:hypothetical protein
VVDGLRTGIFGVEFFSSGEEAAGFFDLESHQAGIPADLMLPQREEAFVLFDLTEDASEIGEEPPEDVSEYTEGLSGRMLDSEIQWCSADRSSHPFQSL